MAKMKTALVLAAGIPQAVLAEKLKKRGYRIVMIDYTADPVGKYAADKFYRISTLDTDAVRNTAISEKADLIMTVCTDQAMLTVSRISEELGLPCYVSYKTGLLMTNKKYMKRIFEENGIPSSRFVIVDNAGDEALSSFRFPMVVKPVDCNSSKGVRKVYDEDGLRSAVTDAVSLSRTHNAVVEEFFEGTELSCDMFVTDGKAKLLTFSVSDKIKSDEKFVIYRSCYPLPYDTPDFRARIEDIAQKIVDAYELSNCPLLVQLLYNGSDFSVIEFSARTGGALKYRIIAETSGVDVIEKTIDVTLDGRAEISPERFDGCYRNEFVYMKNGEFDHLEGFEELKEQGIIENYYLFHKKGFVSTGANSSGDRICGYTIITKNEKKMKECHNIAIFKMKVISTSGEDLFRRDILVKED